MFRTKFVEVIETHISSPINLIENLTVYEMFWENILQSDRPQIKIWRMRIACWIPKATNTFSQYVTLTAVPLQQWLFERPSLLPYMYIVWRIVI
jgi:hypothetical protein